MPEESSHMGKPISYSSVLDFLLGLGEGGGNGLQRILVFDDRASTFDTHLGVCLTRGSLLQSG